MNYQNILPARFIARPNRFIAMVQIGEETVTCHVKNTGRCTELLIPNAAVWIEKVGHPARKTEYDLIAVEKNGNLINIDSQAPNKIAAEWFPESGLFSSKTVFRAEVMQGGCRLDFLAVENSRNTRIEVKGVTLENQGIACFPDAPTQRGVRHLKTLIELAGRGDRAIMLFVVQMKHIAGLRPNDQTHPEFGRVLRKAAAAGVVLTAIECDVKPNSVTPVQRVPILL